MLVLSRKVGERIVIGDGIVITVLEQQGARVRLGIEAPSDVPIWRAEVSFFADEPQIRGKTKPVSASC